LGRHLVEPWRVVLCGRPNVGKSSLINALVGYQRAIVHPLAGTTRDVVTAATAIDGWPIELADTAGLRRDGHPLEQAGIDLARQKMATADLLILVSDATQAWSEDDEALLRSWPKAILVHNKADLAPCRAPRPPGLSTSALTGEGIGELAVSVGTRLVPNPPPSGAPVPFTAGHVGLLVAAHQAASRQDLGAAAQALASLLGGSGGRSLLPPDHSWPHSTREAQPGDQ
jgi:tRNA modification GTPase